MTNKENEQRARELLQGWAHQRGAKVNYSDVPAIRIYTAAADVSDSAAMNELIAAIPNGEELRHILGGAQSGRARAYHRETRTGRYVSTDGKHAECYTVTGITLQQAADIATECDGIERWGRAAFSAAAERVLGPLQLVS